MTVLLIQTDSPITREARNSINENWNRIKAGFDYVYGQLNYLTDDTDLVTLVAKMEKALSDANTSIHTMNILIDECRNKLVEIQNSITNANTATKEAIDAKNSAIIHTKQTITATYNADVATTNANTATANANNATFNATAASNAANTAATRADNSSTLANAAAYEAKQATSTMITTMNNLLNEIHTTLNSFTHLGEFNSARQYVKNNEVYYMGSSFRAKLNTAGISPPNDFSSSPEWQLISRRGTDAPSKDDMFKVWRSKNQPPDDSYIWWYDVNAITDEIINIFKGDVPPTDTRNLWLAPRGVI